MKTTTRKTRKPTIPATDRPRCCDVLTAFTRLVDRDNQVSLVDLRRVCGLLRAEFDAQLRELRIADVLTLSGIEGRNGITAEEREAAVVEHGELLGYVSRRQGD